MIFRLPIVCIGAVFLTICCLSQEVSAQPRYGLWVEAEGKVRPFRSIEEYKAFSSYAEKNPFTDLYCQVYRGGRSWFPSLMADDTPYREARAIGLDPLRQVINEAHSRGQRVHAWINVLRVTHNTEAPLLQVLGPSAVHVDSFQNSLLDYDENGRLPGALGNAFSLGTPGIWLDPSLAPLREYLVETIRDVVVAYPDLDGVHLDMIRYPMGIRVGSKGRFGQRPRFGFSKESVRRFFEFVGKEPPPLTKDLIEKLRKSRAWSTWLRAQVTLLVFQVKEMLNQIAPELELSAAVIANSKRAYSETYQDWSSWRKGSVIDTIVPMNYSRSLSLVSRQSKYAVQSASRGQVIVGLGAWLMTSNPSLLIDQGQDALKNGADGVTLFSYANLASKQGNLVTQKFSNSIFP